MKKIILAAFVLSFSFCAFAIDPTVNEKVLNAFNKTFKNVQDVSWSETENSYQANFKQNQMISRVIYDKEGNIVQTFRYYYEQQLPIMVLAKVKARFSDKKIYGVTEVASEEGLYYYITLEDDKKWVEVKADNYGSLTIEKKFKKA